MTDVLTRIRRATGADEVIAGERIQSLWSGYGEIRRYHLRGAAVASVVAKLVRPPDQRRHPRGWDGDHGHRRKLRSYEVETAWYRGLARRCDAACRVARAYDCTADDNGWLLVLEDLDASGYVHRRSRATTSELRACLGWLAAFHATFLGVTAEDLWPTGTYWHLATRPEEHAATRDPELRAAAPALDAALHAVRHRTLVHGDAKIANFCFAEDGGVAAVDFQYVGGGCGVQDVAYLFSSCLDEEQCELRADEHLDHYFQCLRRTLAQRSTTVDLDALEAEWRAAYPLSWADFVRFLAGWAPEHTKLHGYSWRMTKAALAAIRAR